MKFNGELKFPELDHPGVPVQFVIDDTQAEIVVDGESLGRWSLYDIHAKRLVSSAFLVDLDGTEVTFVAADPIDFAYRGVEHMAATWAKMKARRPGSRSIAVRKSRKDLVPSRIDDLRQAMETNLETTGPRPLAGEHSMPGTAVESVSSESAPPSMDWDRRDEAASIPVVGETGLAADIAEEPVSRSISSQPLVDAEIEEERRRLAEERAKLDEERQAAEQREANLLEAYRLEMERLEAEREELRRQTEAAGLAAEQAALERERADQRAAQLEAAERASEQRAAEEARIAAQEAERLAAEERAAEERAAEEARIEAEERAAEEARREAEEQAQREAEERAAEEARIEAEERAAEEARREAEEQARREVEEREAQEAATAAAVGPPVVDLGDFEDGQSTAGSGVQPIPAPEPAMAKDKGGLMGAVKSAFRGGSKDHVHQFVEAPGGIGITRYVCEECAYVSISVGG